MTPSTNITEYKESLEFLFNQLPMFSRIGAAAYKPGLETSISLDNFFGNPHKKFNSIHVGGTNGKGSTSHMLASVLQSQGYKMGLYTSPHLVDFRERMRINGKMIPKNKVIEFVERWKLTGYNGKPSFFELTMIMAFNWFAEEKVDYAVIEVGMGGRLDSTNIITPILSVITNISHDHNQFLGQTLPEIANEKAGIIKTGIPVIIGERERETEDVFISKSKEQGASLKFADELFKGLTIQESENGWIIERPNGDIVLPLGGEYQKKNIKTVLAAIEELRHSGIEINEASIKEGLENVVTQTGFLGRWTILGKNPVIIADTGHNQAGLTYNFHQLSELQRKRTGSKLRIVIGFVADKAIDKILTLLPKEAIYYVTNAQIPRAMSAEELYIKFQENEFNARSFENVEEAFKAAKKEASENDIIFIGGSTFIVADLLTGIKGN